MAKNSSFYCFAPGVFWGILIVVLSLLPDSSIPSSLFTLLTFDKLLHWFFYGIFVFLWLWGFRNKKTIQLPFSYYFFMAMGAVILGIAMEYAQQTFAIGRFFEWADVLADVIGVLGGAMGFRMFEYYQSK